MADVVTSSNLTAADAPLWNTEAHHGPAVSVVTWFCIVAVVLAVAARTVTRFAITRTLKWDDKLVLLALVGLELPADTNGLLMGVDCRSSL